MSETWIYKHEGNTIKVCNKRAVELYINDVLQDSVKGIRLKAELHGQLPSGEKVQASVFGTVEVECILHIDNVLQQPVQVGNNL